MKRIALLLMAMGMLSAFSARLNATCMISPNTSQTVGIYSGDHAAVPIGNTTITMDVGSQYYFSYVTSGGTFLANFYLLYSGNQWSPGLPITNTTAGPQPLTFFLYDIQNSPTCSSENVDISVFKKIFTGGKSYIWQLECTTSITVVIIEDSHYNLSYVPTNANIFYRTEDSKIANTYWANNTWNNNTLNLANWSGVTVAGDVNAFADLSHVFFKRNISGSYYLAGLRNVNGTWNLSSIPQLQLNLHSRISARNSNEVVFATSTTNLRQEIFDGTTWSNNLITPAGGWPSYLLNTDGLAPGSVLAVNGYNDIFFASQNGVIYQLSLSLSGWTLTQVSPSLGQGYSAYYFYKSDLCTTDNNSIYFCGQDNLVHRYTKVNGVWTFDPMWANPISCEGFLTKSSTSSTIYYKSGGKVIAQYFDAGQNTWIAYALDPNATNVSGDIVSADPDVLYINKDKIIHAYVPSGGNWYDAALGSTTNAFTCAVQYTNWWYGNTRMAQPEVAPQAGTVNIKAYPNPTTGLSKLDFNNDGLKKITVTDVMGKIISSVETTEQAYELDLHEQPSGVYFVTVVIGNDMQSLRIIRE